MTDEKKPAPPPLEPVPEPHVAPEKRTVAVQDDRLWGGPRHIDGIAGRPYVETKTDYFRLLNEAGVRMKDQQESTTGPTRDPSPPPPRPVAAEPVVTPMTMEEAHVYGAITAVFRRYDLIETIWCEDCSRRNRPDGCRMQVTERRVLLECRCGASLYTPPVGTTDLVLRTLPSIARTLADTTSGSVVTTAGIVARPTQFLHDMEALIVRRYFAAIRARHKDARLFHRECWRGNPRVEDEAVAVAISPRQVVLTCPCRTLFHQRVRITRPVAPMKVM